MSVNIRPRVLSLSLLQENVWHYFIQLADQPEQGVIREVLLGKQPLTSIARICLSQHCMTVSRDNLR